MSSGTKILPCRCVHSYQDARYGRGLRVHNNVQTSKKEGYYCTVCNDFKQGARDGQPSLPLGTPSL